MRKERPPTKGSPPTLDQRVLRFILERGLLAERGKVVVAVSGGPDSVCLLHVLTGLRRQLGIELHVAHLDHALRGVESEADALYVADLARRFDIPATVERRDVKDYRLRHRLSLEEAAREVRYGFLAEVAESVGAEVMAVGHTLDDHIETILMHLVRGSGIKGLGGLQASVERQFSGGKLSIVRPLLEIGRPETNDYCREHKLEPRSDASNLSLSPLRNKIRLQLLPRLKSYNPKVVEALVRTARIAADDIAFLDAALRQSWGEVESQQGTVVLDKARFAGLPSALQRHLLRVCLDKLLGDLKDIEARHIEDMMAASGKPAGKRLSLPDGLRFVVEYDRYLIGRDSAALSSLPVLEGETPLAVPGQTELSGWNVEATVATSQKNVTRGEGKALTACLDFDKAGDKLVVRPRQIGDRFQPLGMAQPKKLGEFMIDARIPQAWRERVPIVASPERVLWVVGWRIDEMAKVTEQTRRVLCLKFTRLPGD